ncbi:hypothetical protein ACFL5O_07975 [Myxococcota bacterium]
MNRHAQSTLAVASVVVFIGCGSDSGTGPNGLAGVGAAASPGTRSGRSGTGAATAAQAGAAAVRSTAVLANGGIPPSTGGWGMATDAGTGSPGGRAVTDGSGRAAGGAAISGVLSGGTSANAGVLKRTANDGTTSGRAAVPDATTDGSTQGVGGASRGGNGSNGSGATPRTTATDNANQSVGGASRGGNGSNGSGPPPPRTTATDNANQSVGGASQGGSGSNRSGATAEAEGGTPTGSAATNGATPASGAASTAPGSAGDNGAMDSITVWLAGDSTMAKGSNPCPVGWGAEFDSLFNSRVTVNNSAVGGRSVRTWLYNVSTATDSSGECVLSTDASGKPTVQARWQAMLDGMKEGDYLLIQFGINDGSKTCDRHVGLEAFQVSLGTIAQAAKERGTRPVFLTPVSAIACNGSVAQGTRGGYVTATQEAGESYGVPVVDLHQLSVDLYNSLELCPVPGGNVSASTTGPAGEFFCEDHTHFSATGALEIARLVATALRSQEIGLASYLE